MAETAKIEVKGQDLLTSLGGFFKALLRDGDLGAVLVPQHLPMKDTVMPTLVTDPEKLTGVDPLAPVFPTKKPAIAGQSRVFLEIYGNA